MDKRTYDALQASIEKWQKNVAAEKVEDVKIGPKDCALCNMFWNYGREDCCSGCPVKRATGERHCEDTPYIAADWAHDKWDDTMNEEHGRMFRLFAQREVEFLQALVPAGGCDEDD